MASQTTTTASVSPTKTGYGYQMLGASWLASQRNAILADEVGVGKTGTSIIACDKIGARNILVLAPGIARENWVEEFHDFQTQHRLVLPMLTTKIVPDSDVVVTSYSLMRRPKVLLPLLRRKWDVIIDDEAQYLKNPIANQTIAYYGPECKGVVGLSSKTDHNWLLSGTLMPNNPSELWSHMAALFPDVSQGRSFNQWVDRYCIRKAKSDAIVGVNEEHAGELARLIKPHYLRRTKKQVLPDLPPLTFGQVIVNPDKLPPRDDDIREIEKIVMAALAKAENGRTDEAIQAIKTASEIHLASLRKWTGVAKAPAVAEYLLEELNSGLDKVVIFAIHQEVIETLLRMLPDSVALYGPVPPRLRERNIKGFQGKIPGFNPRVIIIQMEIASTAITLTSAHNVVFAESSWVPKDMEQAAARCHRNGQLFPVLARVFSLKGSVDEQVGRTLVRKIRTISSFNDALLAA